jgi:hypothetical protein
MGAPADASEENRRLREQLEESERLKAELSLSWEEKMRKSQEVQQQAKVRPLPP